MDRAKWYKLKVDHAETFQNSISIKNHDDALSKIRVASIL